MRKWKWERTDVDGSKLDKDRDCSSPGSKSSKKEVSTLSCADRAAPSGEDFKALVAMVEKRSRPVRVVYGRSRRDRQFKEAEMVRFEGYGKNKRQINRN